MIMKHISKKSAPSTAIRSVSILRAAPHSSLMDVIVIGIDTVLDIHFTVVVFIPLRNTHAENDRDN